MLRPTSLLRLSRSAKPASAFTSARFESTTPTPSPSIHEIQSQPRTETLQRTRDKAGITADAVAQAVKNTQARQGANANGSTEGQSSDAQQRNKPAGGPRRAGQGGKGQGESRLGAALAMRRRLSEQRVFDPDAKEVASRLATRDQKPGGHRLPGGRRRTPAGAEAEAEVERVWTPRTHDGGERPARFNNRRYNDANASAAPSDRRQSPRSNSSAPRPPRAPRGPRTPRSSPLFGGADVKPLPLPTKAPAPASVNLAQLIAADLKSRAAALKTAVPVQAAESATQAERLAHRKERAGDYSRWHSAGAEGAAANLVGNAEQLLAANPSIGLAGRQEFLATVKKLTARK